MPSPREVVVRVQGMDGEVRELEILPGSGDTDPNARVIDWTFLPGQDAGDLVMTIIDDVDWDREGAD